MQAMVWVIAAALALAALLALMSRGVARRAEARVPATGRFIELSCARLHIIERGPVAGSDSPPLILVHGLGGQARHFCHSLIDDLARTHHVIAIDRPGAGYSTWHRKATTTLEVQADLLAELIAALGLTRAVIVGHSLGGAIALSTALRHRARVAGLVLLAPLTVMPASRVSGRPMPALRLRVGDRVLAVLAAVMVLPLAWLTRKRSLDVIFGSDPVPDDYGDRGGGDLTLRTGQLAFAMRDLLEVPALLEAIVPRYAELGSTPSLPLSMLYGDEDRVLDSRLQTRALADRVPHVVVERLSAGHMLPLTRPDQCAGLIRRCAGPALS